MTNQFDAVSYYHSLNRFGVQPGLSRIAALCKALGDPQKALSCVHVAGTNGKGSTCTLIASVLQAAGFRTGLYTSPFVLDFRERIRLNGEMISYSDLDEVTLQVRQAILKLNEEGVFPTEFEAVTAAAFLYYKRKKCDVVVLETGLGGRFDATNLIEKPLLSVITSISLDHTAILGDTIEKIAWEKSGIIKPGVPVIVSRAQDPKALAVIRDDAFRQNAPLILSDRTRLQICNASLTGTDVLYYTAKLHCPFPGKHQTDNLGLALTAIDALRQKGWRIPMESIRTGVAAAFIPARTEVLSADPLILLDGAHNPDGLLALTALIRSFMPESRLLGVVGMMEDKDLESAVRLLAGVFRDVITVTPTNPRAIPAARFAEMFRKHGISAEALDCPEDAIITALSRSHFYDGVIVCGSLYLAADVRPILLQSIESISLSEKGGTLS